MRTVTSFINNLILVQILFGKGLLRYTIVTFTLMRKHYCRYELFHGNSFYLHQSKCLVHMCAEPLRETAKDRGEKTTERIDDGMSSRW
jgi:hypothetical protein